MQIEKTTVQFLGKLEKNNSREWFAAHKDEFHTAQENIKAFLAAVEAEMNKIDVIEKTKLFRIYRDVRFSKDKTPYNKHLSFSMSREGAHRRGGYFFKIDPREAFVACGFWAPEPNDLKLIRDHIAQDAKPLRKILSSKKFKDNFGYIEGEQLKNTPKGYDKEHPAADLLKYKQFIVVKKFDIKTATGPNFVKEVINAYKAVRPWFDYMSDILTHDVDGVPIYVK
jgi:uncharacterized protein (TIGR02453 family)